MAKRNGFKHIGIVGCSAPGAALCYQTICTEGAALTGEKSFHPEVTMHTYPLSEYMRFIKKDDWAGVAELMLGSARVLAGAGADFLITPDNTIHQSMDFFSGRSPLPWLHIADEVAAEARRLGCRRLALLGTRYLMEGPVYPARLAAAGLECRLPAPAERERINTYIFSELTEGRATPEARKYFLGVIERMRGEGCDCAGLCCTEIPLLLRPGDTALPLLDSTRLLARAALRAAGAD